MLSVLAVMGVSIAVCRLARGIVRMGIPQLSQRRNLVAERESHARAVRAPRCWQRQIGEPRPMISGRELPGDIDRSVAFRILVRLSHPAHQDRAAALAIQAVLAMRQALGSPTPVCLRRRTSSGGSLLDIRFHVADVRRGKEHVLSEAMSNIWDLFHEHQIAFTVQPNEPAGPDAVAA
jgi:hypothetical protein